MIRNETEYQAASARVADERNRLTDHRARLKEAGLSDEEIKRVIDPMESFHLQLKEEVESYERAHFCCGGQEGSRMGRGSGGGA